jgi:hypothetical protein
MTSGQAIGRSRPEHRKRPGMIATEDPPGFVVRTEVQKAAWDNGFRLERGVEPGGCATARPPRMVRSGSPA